MLSLDVEFIHGTYHGTSGPDDHETDWPPQPDRAFSAFVETWACRGKRTEETEALEWLERQAVPIILASEFTSRHAPTVYVPPNDVPTASIQVLPDRRRRQERRFPAALPADPCVTYVWPHASPPPQILESLHDLAHDTGYVGRAASLTRCLFTETSPELRERRRVPAGRWVYRGRLIELERDHCEHRRPRPGASVSVKPYSPMDRESTFGDRWHIFADIGSTTLDAVGSAIVTYTFRTALLSAFSGEKAPEIISGHTQERWPTRKPHLAILPMLNVGWRWSDGHLMGIALCLPRDSSTEDERALVDALSALISTQRRSHRDAVWHVSLGLPGRITLPLLRQPHPDAESLKTNRYVQLSKRWSTVTPIVLDHELHADDPNGSFSRRQRMDEMSYSIAQACTYIGLPKPVEVVCANESAVRGSPPIRHVGPSWGRWKIPPAVKRATLTHATLVFRKPVRGPIILGAGRFYGLGLCLPPAAGT